MLAGLLDAVATITDLSMVDAAIDAATEASYDVDRTCIPRIQLAEAKELARKLKKWVMVAKMAEEQLAKDLHTHFQDSELMEASKNVLKEAELIASWPHTAPQQESVTKLNDAYDYARSCRQVESELIQWVEKWDEELLQTWVNKANDLKMIEIEASTAAKKALEHMAKDRSFCTMLNLVIKSGGVLSSTINGQTDTSSVQVDPLQTLIQEVEEFKIRMAPTISAFDVAKATMALRQAMLEADWQGGKLYAKVEETLEAGGKLGIENDEFATAAKAIVGRKGMEEARIKLEQGLAQADVDLMESGIQIAESFEIGGESDVEAARALLKEIADWEVKSKEVVGLETQLPEIEPVLEAAR